MIVNFRDGWLRDFFVDDVRSRNIPSDLEGRLFRRLQMIDDASTVRTCAYRRAIISKSCAASWLIFIRSASTSSGDSFSGGTAIGAKRQMSISMTMATNEVKDANDQT
jgi:hypothetical protein